VDDRGLRQRRLASEALLARFDVLARRAGVASSTGVGVRRAGRVVSFDWCAPNAELAGLTASDVTVPCCGHRHGVGERRTKLFVTALRSFLRFSFVEGLTPIDLSAAALSVARRRRSSLPMGIDRKTAAGLLGSCNRRRPKAAGLRRLTHLASPRVARRRGRPPSASMTSTGGPARSWCTARDVTRTAPAAERRRRGDRRVSAEGPPEDHRASGGVPASCCPNWALERMGSRA